LHTLETKPIFINKNMRKDATNLSIYVHVPYCVTKCRYCDFNSYGGGVGLKDEKQYVSALLREIEGWKDCLATSETMGAPTIYWGGGTPSLLSVEAVQTILKAIQDHWQVEPDVEITLEMNPKTADLQKMRGFKKVGVNRLSIGIQSLNDKILSGLGRAHTAKEALECLGLAFQAGFENVSADVMYGLPGQTQTDFIQTLQTLCQFPLTHISAYSLIIEEGTPFYRSHREGKLALPDDEEIQKMENFLQQKLEACGFIAYEISNYAKPHFFSQHNLNYWHYRPYLGLGAGAVGFLPTTFFKESFLVQAGMKSDVYGYRVTNPKTPAHYIEKSNRFETKSVEVIDYKTSLAEYWMMGLRKRGGIETEDLERRFKVDFYAKYGKLMAQLMGQGYISCSDGKVALTHKGRNFANDVMQVFIE